MTKIWEKCDKILRKLTKICILIFVFEDSLKNNFLSEFLTNLELIFQISAELELHPFFEKLPKKVIFHFFVKIWNFETCFEISNNPAV